MDNNGWVKLHRKLLENPISGKPNYLAVWIYILLHANHKDKEIIWNRKKITVKRGSFIGSISKMAQHLDLSTGTVSYILDYFISERMIERSSNYRFTLFHIINYDMYQSDVESSFESKVKAKRKQSETNKNEKNEKKYIDSSLKILKGYNTVFKKNYKSTSVWFKNYVHWRKTYSDKEIATAIVKASEHPWWKDKLTLEKLFRTRNSNGACDYIGELLNS